MSKIKNFFKLALALVLGFCCVTGFAEDPPTGSTIIENQVTVPGGIDIVGLINSGVTVLGGIVAVAIAAWAGWLIVKLCLKWIRRSFT